MSDKKNRKVKNKFDAEYILKNTDKIIKSKKRKKVIVRIIVLFSILISTLITLALKLEYFNVQNVSVLGNVVIEEEKIKDLANVTIGENIFKINCNEIANNVKQNGYILKVEAKRKIPNTIQIDVEERKARFYQFHKNEFYVIDESGVLLEKKSGINGMSLTRVDGLKFDDVKEGEIIEKDDFRKCDFFKEVSKLIDENKSHLVITQINVTDMSDIIVSINNMRIFIGTKEDLKEKLNKAINIIIAKNLEEISGYINISFKGNPVLYIDK